MHLSAPFIAAPSPPSLLSLRARCWPAPSRIAFYRSHHSRSRITRHQRQRRPARRQPRDHGVLRRHAARTPVRPHRRRHQMTSSSTLGSANVTLQFDLNRNVDAAARDVQAAINAARSNLPANLPQNPSYRKSNPAEAPILILTLTSDIKTKPQMYDAADSILDQKIAQIDGVGQVFAWGSASPSVRVELNPYQLANNQVGLEAVRTAISSANANRPKGSFQTLSSSDESQRWQINDNDQIFKAVDYAPLIVGYNPQTGAPVRLSDVATVYDGTADVRNAATLPRIQRWHQRSTPAQHCCCRFQGPRGQRHQDRRQRTCRAAATAAVIPPSSTSMSPSTAQPPSAPASTMLRRAAHQHRPRHLRRLPLFARDTGNRHLLPSLCRSRSSAHSASCIFSATPWTTSR